MNRYATNPPLTLKMKHLPLIACLLLAPVCFGQKVELATSIAPEDLGAYKWTLSGTAEENNVVIFRLTTIREWPNGKVTTNIHDTVEYTPGKKQTVTAFFYDPHYFENRDKEPTWHFRAIGETGSIEGKYAGHSYGDGKNEIHFNSVRWGKTTKAFETFIMSHEAATLLHPDLPPIPENGGWAWAGDLKEQSEQVGTDQPM
ncbi:MAG: hypothetical protein ACSHX4_06110 [Opitutaceae bacterium]